MIHLTASFLVLLKRIFLTGIIFGCFSPTLSGQHTLIPRNFIPVVFNPDGVYPVLNNYGCTEGVNLSTGALNLTFDLATLTSSQLNYTLKAFYNSRSAGINHQFPGEDLPLSVLGGWGWKLMDYPKIVQAKDRYYLLDGQGAYPLQVTSQQGDLDSEITSFVPSGPYYLWQITRSMAAESSNASAATWKIQTASGVAYSFDEQGVGLEYVEGYVWQLSQVIQSLWPDTLWFEYQGDQLINISNSRKDSLVMIYSTIDGEQLLQAIAAVQNGVITDSVLLDYSSVTLTIKDQERSYSLLSGINNSMNVGNGIFKSPAPAIRFAYIDNTADDNGFQGGMLQITGPEGATSNFTYGTTAHEFTDTSGTTYTISAYPIIQNRIFTGYDNIFTAYKYQINNSQSAVNYGYLQYNQATVYPGGQFVDDSYSKPYGWETYYFFDGFSPLFRFENFKLPKLYEYQYLPDSVKYTPEELAPPVTYFTSDKIALNGPVIIAFQYQDAKALTSSSTIDPATGNLVTTYDPVPLDVNVDLYDNGEKIKEITLAADLVQKTEVFIPFYDTINPLDFGLNPLAGNYSYSIRIGVEAGEPGLVDASITLRDFYTGPLANPYWAGSPYATFTYNSKGEVVDSGSYLIANNFYEPVAKGLYTRMLEKISMTKGLSDTLLFRHDPITGQVKQYTTYNYNSSGKRDSLRSTTTYWWEKYDPDRSLNLLTPVVQATDSMNTAITSILVNTWKDWSNNNSGQWAPWENFTWEGSGSPDFPNWTTNDSPDSDWLETDAISHRNTSGRPIQEFNVDSIFSSTLYDASGLYPVAVFENAQLVSEDGSQGNQCDYMGFESYEYTTDSYWKFNGAEITHEDKHTGKTSLTIGPGQSIQASFVPDTRSEQQYILSCWVKTPASYESNTANLSLEAIASSSGQILAGNSTNILHTGGAWAYVSTVLKIPVSASPVEISATINNNGSQTIWVDDVRFSPYGSFFAAMIYNDDMDLFTAMTGNNAQTYRIFYNEFKEPIATAGPAEHVVSLSAGYFSLSDHTNFDPDQPNSSLTILARNGGPFDDFNDGEPNGWTFEYPSDWFVVDDKLICKNYSGEKSKAILDGSDRANYGFRVQVSDANGVVGIGIGEISVEYNVATGWLLLDGPTTVATQTGSMGQDWLLVTQDDGLLFYNNGKLIFNQAMSGIVEGECILYTAGQNSTAAFDDVLVFIDPLVHIRYANGTGNVIQTQAMKGINCIAAQSLYDSLSRLVIQTRPILLSNASGPAFASYHPDLVTNGQLSGSLWQDGIMTGLVAEAYPNDQGYPYYRQSFTNSPLSLPYQTGLPGKDFAIGQGHTQQLTAGVNTSNIFGDLYPPGKYRLITSNNPDSDNSYLLSDQFGNPVATKAATINEGSAVIQPQNAFNYNLQGDLVSYQQPNYFDPPKGSQQTDWVNTAAYDFLGKVTRSATTDTDSSWYIYEPSGQIRFMMNALGKAANPNRIIYFKYDPSDNMRLIETGYYPYNWDSSALQHYADTDPGWPATPDTWYQRYRYNGDGSVPYLNGRLDSILVNNDFDLEADVIETYRYDQSGRVTLHTLKALDFGPDVHITAYHYDNLGNPVQLDYLPQNIILENSSLEGNIGLQAADTIIFIGNTRIGSDADIQLQAGKLIDFTGEISLGDHADISAATSHMSDMATSISYSYNHMAQLVAVGTPPDPDQFAAYAYHPDGSIASKMLNNTYENGYEVTYGYNIAGWIKVIESPLFKDSIVYRSDGYENDVHYYDGVISNITYAYDPSIFPENPAYDMKMEYDEMNQVEVAQNSMELYTIGVKSNVLHDANQNVLAVSRNGEEETITYVSGKNQVQEYGVDGYNWHLNHDIIGNVTQSPRLNVANISYGMVNNLSSQINMDDGSSLQFQYGGGDRRILKQQVKGTEYSATLYQHGMNDYPLVEKRRSDGASETSTFYIYGPDGLLAMQQDGETYYILKDHLGSSRVVTNATNQPVAAFDYMPYGDTTRTFGRENLLNYRYTGQEFDPSIGLYNYRARFYDPQLGQFYAPDPAGQYNSPYIYVGNDPLSNIDPTGEVDCNNRFQGDQDVIDRTVLGAALIIQAAARVFLNNLATVRQQAATTIQRAFRGFEVRRQLYGILNPPVEGDPGYPLFVFDVADGRRRMEVADALGIPPENRVPLVFTRGFELPGPVGQMLGRQHNGMRIYHGHGGPETIGVNRLTGGRVGITGQYFVNNIFPLMAGNDVGQIYFWACNVGRTFVPVVAARFREQNRAITVAGPRYTFETYRPHNDPANPLHIRLRLFRDNQDDLVTAGINIEDLGTGSVRHRFSRLFGWLRDLRFQGGDAFYFSDR